MGKYMRKGKCVDKMPAMEGSLGVRTRARALALQRDSRSRPKPSNNNSDGIKQISSTSCFPTTARVEEAPCRENYMELRSRKVSARVSSIARNSPEKDDDKGNVVVVVSHHPHHYHLVKNSTMTRCSISDDESSRHPHSIPNRNVHPNECLRMQSSSAIDAGSVHLRRVTPTGSTSNSVCVAERQPLGILTRHRRQELANLALKGMDMNDDLCHTNLSHANSAEVEQCFGESAMIGPSNGDRQLSSSNKNCDESTMVGASNKDRQLSSNIKDHQFCDESAMLGASNKDRQRRGGTRESTPDSYIRSMEAPGSTSRSRHPHRGVVGGQSRSLSAPPFDRAHEAPSSSEIEAFFQGAEQQERRKFIKRYNFDPANERPLRGRYEWVSL